MNQAKRWVLLRHRDAPDDEAGLHYDLLLEDNQGCRTWRLSEIPVCNGKEVPVSKAPIHKLEWLEKRESEVSQGRGWASRLAIGTFIGTLPDSETDPIAVNLDSETIAGRLEIKDGFCRIVSL